MYVQEKLFHILKFSPGTPKFEFVTSLNIGYQQQPFPKTPILVYLTLSKGSMSHFSEQKSVLQQKLY
jgi:hypothetical protein